MRPAGLRLSFMSNHGSKFRVFWDSAGMLVVFAVLFLLCSLRVEYFFSAKNMEGLLLSVATTGTIACTMFPSAYASSGHNLEKDRIVLLKGRASHRERVRDDDDGGPIVEVLAEEIFPLANGAGAADRVNKIMIQVDPTKRDVLRYVRETVEQYRGNGGAAPVHVRVQDGGQVHEVRTELLAEYNDAFRQALERLLGRQSVWVE